MVFEVSRVYALQFGKCLTRKNDAQTALVMTKVRIDHLAYSNSTIRPITLWCHFRYVATSNAPNFHYAHIGFSELQTTQRVHR
jgi:hypothetical protein